MKPAKSLVKSIVSATLALCATPAIAANYPKAYDAEYESKSPLIGTRTIRLTSDGKGKLRSESNSGTYKVVSITDYPAMISYGIMDAQKMIVKTTMKEPYSDMTPEVVKAKKAQDLGVKNVAGHQAHGWKYTEKGVTMETWIDEKAGLAVKTITTTPDNKMNSEMTLTKYDAKQPAASLFVIPTGYRVMQTPAQ